MSSNNNNARNPSPFGDGVSPQNSHNPSPFRDGVSSPFSNGVSSPFREAGRGSQLDTARLMYMAGDSTQRSIAKTLRVSERTVYTWIKTHGWDRLRQAARTAPAIIAENIFSQIVELQTDIASREEGKRYPTMQEAELTRKLVLSVDRMKSAPALSQTMQVLRMFRSFANSYGDSKFRFLLNQVIEHFVEGEAKDGYLPYQVEYGPAETPEPELQEVDLEVPTESEEENRSEASHLETPPSPSERPLEADFSNSNATSDTQLAPAKVGSKSEVSTHSPSHTSHENHPSKTTSDNVPVSQRKSIGRLAAFRK